MIPTKWEKHSTETVKNKTHCHKDKKLTTDREEGYFRSYRRKSSR
jgi:hypothetical protein